MLVEAVAGRIELGVAPRVVVEDGYGVARRCSPLPSGVDLRRLRRRTRPMIACAFATSPPNE